MVGGRAPQGARGLKSIEYNDYFRDTSSRPARGAWVEILLPDIVNVGKQSRPARGAWVEMREGRDNRSTELSRPARGAWVEILIGLAMLTSLRRRAPQGARGLKFSAESQQQL